MGYPPRDLDEYEARYKLSLKGYEVFCPMCGISSDEYEHGSATWVEHPATNILMCPNCYRIFFDASLPDPNV